MGEKAPISAPEEPRGGRRGACSSFPHHSLTPSRRGPRNSHRTVPHGAKGWGKLTLPASHSIQLLLHQWVTVTMETNKFLHITGEPACQQPGLWGRQKAACSRKAWLIPQRIVGSSWRLTSAAEVPGSPSNFPFFASNSCLQHTACLHLCGSGGRPLELALWWGPSTSLGQAEEGSELPQISLKAKHQRPHNAFF